MKTVRGNTVCPCGQADSCRDPQYDADWHPLKDTEGGSLILPLVLTVTVTGQLEISRDTNSDFLSYRTWPFPRRMRLGRARLARHMST